MSSPLTDSAEESSPESELSGSDGEDNGSALLLEEDSSSVDDVFKKQ